jgi:MoxR-like ATPase
MPTQEMSNREAFTGTSRYIATRELQIAVNAAVSLQKPLLIKGEPGTGKTMLAHEVALALELPIITWYVKSTTTAQQGLYEYDAVSRLRDSQLGSERIQDIAHYIRKGKLWEAFDAPQTTVLLIDEIDKADLEFPNDLLLELDKMEFYCYELGQTISARQRPIVVITSNNEKELPDAFLRRCLFHYIRFPDRETMQNILNVHYPDLDAKLITSAMRLFYEMREARGLKKKPSTSELIDWIKLLILDGLDAKDLDAVNLKSALPPHLHALIKNEVDLGILESLGRGIY